VHSNSLPILSSAQGGLGANLWKELSRSPNLRDFNTVDSFLARRAIQDAQKPLQSLHVGLWARSIRWTLEPLTVRLDRPGGRFRPVVATIMLPPAQVRRALNKVHFLR
jgi:hypothetical protein